MEELETNKFWDFSRNIDLEDFDTQRVYRILMNQERFLEFHGPYRGLSWSKNVIRRVEINLKTIKVYRCRLRTE